MSLESINTEIVVAIITGIVTYITTRIQANRERHSQAEELEMERTRLLLQDQNEFRETLMEEFRRSREQISYIQEHNDTLTAANIDLRRKIMELQVQNNELLIQLSEIRTVNLELMERVGNIEQSDDNEEEEAEW